MPPTGTVAPFARLEGLPYPVGAAAALTGGFGALSLGAALTMGRPVLDRSR